MAISLGIYPTFSDKPMYLSPIHLPLVIPCHQPPRQVLMGQLVGTVTTDEVRWSNQATWVWTPKTGDMSWGMVQEKWGFMGRNHQKWRNSWDLASKNGGNYIASVVSQRNLSKPLESFLKNTI